MKPQVEAASLRMEEGLARERPIRSMGRSAALSCRWWVAFIAATALVVSGHLLIKAGLNAFAGGPAAGFWSRLGGYLIQPMVVEGLLIYALGSLCWMAAVAQGELSYLYPLTSVNYVLIVMGSALLFEESISFKRGAGVALIVLGVLFLNRRSKGPRA